MKQHLPDQRAGLTKSVKIGDVKIYISTGEYEDGRIGELFIRVDKQGSEMRVYDCLAIAVSLGLQHGVPISDFVEKLSYQRMPPDGITTDTEIPIAMSIVDYVFRWIGNRYLVD